MSCLDSVHVMQNSCRTCIIVVDLKDNRDIRRQARAIYCRGNIESSQNILWVLRINFLGHILVFILLCTLE